MTTHLVRPVARLAMEPALGPRLVLDAAKLAMESARLVLDMARLVLDTALGEAMINEEARSK